MDCIIYSIQYRFTVNIKEGDFMETIIALLIGAIAVYVLYKNIKKSASGDCSGCSGCSSASHCSSYKESKDE